MSKRWVKGPALEVMMQLSPKFTSPGLDHIHKHGIFLPGDELLLDFSKEIRRYERAKSWGVKRPPYVGVVIVETISKQPALRIRLKGSRAPSGKGTHYDQWGFWRCVVGWRRP
jgi:hypothetical protein